MATKKKTEEVKKTAPKAAAVTEKAEEKAAPEVKKAVKPAEAKKPAKSAAKKVEKETKETVKKAEKETKAAAKTAKKAAKTTKKVAEKSIINTTVKGLFFEYGEKQVDASALSELAKNSYKENGGKAAVRTLELYVKAEDNALYYVVNGKDSGKVEL